jgi:hypothetical protein
MDGGDRQKQIVSALTLARASRKVIVYHGRTKELLGSGEQLIISHGGG